MHAQEEAAPAILCDMTSAPDTGDGRLAEYARLFDAAFVSRETTTDRVSWRLRADAGIEAWSRDLADREMACCAFMTITVTVVGDHVVWDATTIDDPTARSVLDLYYDLPKSRHADVESLRERFDATGIPIVVKDGSVTRAATPTEIRHGRSPRADHR